MHNIKLTVAYDGTDFSGWQVQPGQATVQGTLTDVLEKITQQRTLVQGAGRTDAGVHAMGQVANFTTSIRNERGRVSARIQCACFHLRFEYLLRTR